MSELRTLLRRYERDQGRADRTGLDLALAITERIRTGGRGEASACARELGWDRRRLDAWLKVRAERITNALTEEAARPERAQDSTLTEPDRSSK